MMCRGIREGGGAYAGAFGQSRLLSLSKDLTKFLRFVPLSTSS